MRYFALGFMFASLVLFSSCEGKQSGKDKFVGGGPRNSSAEFKPPAKYEEAQDGLPTADGSAVGVGNDDDPKETKDPKYDPKTANTFKRTDPKTKEKSCILTDQKKSGDFVDFPWPKAIKACFDSGRLYDFFNNRCATVPQAKEFKCNWEDAYEAQIKRIGIKANPIGTEERKKYAKLVGCGEIKDDKYDMIVLQYWYPTQNDLNSCSVATNWRIYTSCRYLRIGHDVDLTWGECLQYSQEK